MPFTPKLGLSKSKYTNFCKCSKCLWLGTYHSELSEITESDQARFDAGNQVGDLAMGLFGDYVEVTSYVDGVPENGLDKAAMIEKTKARLADGTQNICEAAFSFDGNYCAVDILRKTSAGYEMYEVKSSSDSHDDPDKMLCYSQDIAYQKYVLEHCGIKVTGTYLVRINHDYVRGKELDIQGLFSITDMAERVAEEFAHVETRIKQARACLGKENPPDISIGKSCNTPYGCSFWGYCAKDLPQPSVLDLYRGGAKKWEYLKQGKFTLADIREERLSAMQSMIVNCMVDNRPHIDRNGIESFLNTLRYPLYFFDFETIQPAIPEYENTKPYQQVCFQYSLHIQAAPGAPVEHKEFLADPHENPLRLLAESVCRDIPRDVCVVVYNASFEKTRLKEMANMFGDLAGHLMDIHNNIKDLLDPFQKGCCYLPAMGNSFSIKSVLPALFPDDPELDYHNLEGVHNGGEASSIFLKIRDMSPEEAERTRQNLLKYCGLDTYAMVKVLEKLRTI